MNHSFGAKVHPDLHLLELADHWHIQELLKLNQIELYGTSPPKSQPPNRFSCLRVKLSSQWAIGCLQANSESLSWRTGYNIKTRCRADEFLGLLPQGLAGGLAKCKVLQ